MKAFIVQCRCHLGQKWNPVIEYELVKVIYKLPQYLMLC